MAYLSKEHKARIAAKLKEVMPKGWKYSLSVQHHQSIRLVFLSAPVDIVAALNKDYRVVDGHVQLNQYYIDRAFNDENITKVMVDARNALNLDNYDRGDTNTDYSDVGHYVNMHIGKFDKPFVVKA